MMSSTLSNCICVCVCVYIYIACIHTLLVEAEWQSDNSLSCFAPCRLPLCSLVYTLHLLSICVKIKDLNHCLCSTQS